MKIRCDFVTNSSSSSFILARKGGLSDRQKEAIIRVVERNYLGSLLLEAGDSEQEIEDVFDRGWFHDGRITNLNLCEIYALAVRAKSGILRIASSMRAALTPMARRTSFWARVSW